MVTSEGIRANPRKMKAVDDIQSLKTLKEMKSLTAEQAFQELKRLIIELPKLNTHSLKETLYVYLAASREAVSGVLMADHFRKQTLIRYVSRTLHEAKKNYAPLEKLALCLLHLSRRLRRYFEAHPIKVITDQPVKQTLSKPEASGKLAKYAVELGAYNIAYMPRNAVKGQWTLFTDGPSSLKGAGAGLVLIDPARIEYTYAIRLNFTSTNNEAEYEALLADLRIAEKMKVQGLKSRWTPNWWPVR
ncbi:reverse transcriptase domain-containing protein [Tanacetum coccineum]